MVKEFSNQEKALIRSIYRNKDSNGYVLTNVFAWWLDNRGIRFDINNGKLIFDGAIYSDINTILNVRKDIIGTALLIKYLEDNGYIYIINDQLSGGGLSFVGATNIQIPKYVDLPDDIANIIKRSTYTIYVSYSLTSFVENDFRTYEDLQLTKAADTLDKADEQVELARKQVRNSWIAIFVAIVLPILIPICTGESKFQADVQETIHKTNTILQQSADSICHELDSLNQIGNLLHHQNKEVKSKPNKNNK